MARSRRPIVAALQHRTINATLERNGLSVAAFDDFKTMRDRA
jgi:hypothetical protein